MQSGVYVRKPHPHDAGYSCGAGCTVGTTMTVSNRIVPNLVGVDIGCGMYTLKLKEKHIELQKLDKAIREKIPSGFGIRSKPHALAEEAELSSLRCIKAVNPGACGAVHWFARRRQSFYRSR